MYTLLPPFFHTFHFPIKNSINILLPLLVERPKYPFATSSHSFHDHSNQFTFTISYSSSLPFQIGDQDSNQLKPTSIYENPTYWIQQMVAEVNEVSQIDDDILQKNLLRLLTIALRHALAGHKTSSKATSIAASPRLRSLAEHSAH